MTRIDGADNREHRQPESAIHLDRARSVTPPLPPAEIDADGPGACRRSGQRSGGQSVWQRKKIKLYAGLAIGSRRRTRTSVRPKQGGHLHLPGFSKAAPSAKGRRRGAGALGGPSLRVRSAARAPARAGAGGRQGLGGRPAQRGFKPLRHLGEVLIGAGIGTAATEVSGWGREVGPSVRANAHRRHFRRVVWAGRGRAIIGFRLRGNRFVARQRGSLRGHARRHRLGFDARAIRGGVGLGPSRLVLVRGGSSASWFWPWFGPWLGVLTPGLNSALGLKSRLGPRFRGGGSAARLRKAWPADRCGRFHHDRRRAARSSSAEKRAAPERGRAARAFAPERDRRIGQASASAQNGLASGSGAIRGRPGGFDGASARFAANGSRPAGGNERCWISTDDVGRTTDHQEVLDVCSRRTSTSRPASVDGGRARRITARPRPMRLRFGVGPEAVCFAKSADQPGTHR